MLCTFFVAREIRFIKESDVGLFVQSYLNDII
jgi:hypothetical protein